MISYISQVFGRIFPPIQNALLILQMQMSIKDTSDIAFSRKASP